MPQEGLDFRALREDQVVQVALEFKPGDSESNDENVCMVLQMLHWWFLDLGGVWRLDKAEFGRIC